MRISKFLISKILILATIFSLFCIPYAVNADGVNFALKKSVMVSRETDDKNHSLVTDGNKDITSSSKSWNVKSGDSLVLDLGSQVEFNQIIVYEYSFQRAKGYTLEVSGDNNTWKMLDKSDKLLAPFDLDYKTNAPHYAGVIATDKVKARYIKLTIDSTGEKVSYIEEIEVYNSPEPEKYPGNSFVSVKEETLESSGGFSVVKPSEVVKGNFASGKPVMVSHVTSGKNHAKITDGLRNITSSSNAWNLKAGDFCVIDLEEIKNVDCVVVYEYSHLRAKDYTLELSEDNINWKTLAKVTDYVCLNGETGVVTNAPHYYGKIEFDKTKARYIKFTVNETQDNKLSYIEEIEVYDKANMPDIKNTESEKQVELNPPVVVDTIPYSKENFHIYLFIGQSNMNGRDAVPSEDTVVLDKVFLLNNEGKWEKAQPYPFGTKYKVYQGYNRYSTVDESTKNGMNPATSFARAVEQNVPENVGIGIISNARGGTSIEKWQKGSGEKLYEEAVRRTKEAIEHGGTLKGILWLQGESCSRKEGYLDKLNAMVTNMRAELGVGDSVPFIASQIIQTRPDGNAVISQIANTVVNSDFVSSEGTDTIDGLHFNAESQRLIGVRYAEKIINKVYEKNVSADDLYNNIYNDEIIPDYEYKIKINGKYLITDVEPLLSNGRILVPLRAIFEALGAEVLWEDSTMKVTGKRGDKTVVMFIGNNNAMVNDKSVSVDVAPMLVNQRTMIPIRFVSESLGAEVIWDDKTNTASINLK